jgi:hypothetical protein
MHPLRVRPQYGLKRTAVYGVCRFHFTKWAYR